MIEHVKTALLVGSVLLNVAFIAFFAVLLFTPYLNVPLAAYSHQKNCETEFEATLKLADKLPTEQQQAAKQTFATLVCQKDAQTGRALNGADFAKMFEQFSGQPVPDEVKSQIPTQ